MCLFMAPAAAAGATAATTAAATTTTTTAAAAAASAAAANMMAASMAASIIGAGVSAYGQWRQAKAQKTMANAEAKMAQQNKKYADAQAADAVTRGGEADIELRRKYAQTRGRQVAGLAANGVALDEGSPLSVLQDTDMFEQMDSQRTRDNARREEWGFKVQGANYAGNAAMSRAAGRNAIGSAPFAIGSTLLSSATEVADKWLRYREVT